MTRYLSVASYAYMVMPIVTLLVFFVVLLLDGLNPPKDTKATAIPAISVLLVGITILVFGLNVMKIKWANFRFKIINMIAMIISFVFIGIYQGLVIFGIDHEDKLLPYSAFFLNINVMLLTFLVFFGEFAEVKDITYLLVKFFPQGGAEIDRHREDDLMKEIDE